MTSLQLFFIRRKIWFLHSHLPFFAILIRDFFLLFLFVKDKNSEFPLDFYIAFLFQVFDCPHACDETHLGCQQSVLPPMRREFQLKTERLCSHSYKAPWLNGRLADCFRNGQLWGPPTPLHFCKAGDWRMLIHISHILYLGIYFPRNMSFIRVYM